MIKRLQTVLTLSLLLGTAASHAQTQTLAGFTISNKKAVTPLYDGNDIKGYTMFYRADMVGNKMDNYGIDFYDQDLQKLGTATLPKERYVSHLIRRAYNGETFSLYFYNSRSKMLELDVFDNSMNKVASRQFPTHSKAELNVALQELHSASNGGITPLSGLNLYPVPDKGYVRNGYTDKMKGFSLEMYDNSLELKWRYMSDETAKDFESLFVHEVTAKFVLATIARRSTPSSKALDYFTAAFDVETGEKILDIAVENDNIRQLTVSSFSFDDTKGEFVAMGAYYKPGDAELKGRGQGFYLKRIGLNGKENAVKFFDWEKDVYPLLPQEAKQSLEEGYANFVHKIVKGADGRQHIVAEQYKLKPDAVGIALSVMGAGSGMVKGVIGNMMMYTLNDALGLEKVSFFEKDKTDCVLPPGTGAYGAGLAGLIINANGGFDYQFTQEEESQLRFNTAYINYREVKKSRFREKTLVNIRYAENAELITDKIDVSNNHNVSFVYPAKPGYVLVLDSQSEQEKLEMKLVKLNR